MQHFEAQTTRLTSQLRQVGVEGADHDPDLGFPPAPPQNLCQAVEHPGGGVVSVTPSEGHQDVSDPLADTTIPPVATHLATEQGVVGPQEKLCVGSPGLVVLLRGVGVLVEHHVGGVGRGVGLVVDPQQANSSLVDSTLVLAVEAIAVDHHGIGSNSAGTCDQRADIEIEALRRAAGLDRSPLRQEPLAEGRPVGETGAKGRPTSASDGFLGQGQTAHHVPGTDANTTVGADQQTGLGARHSALFERLLPHVSVELDELGLGVDQLQESFPAGVDVAS